MAKTDAKWADELNEFVAELKETSTVKRLTHDINEVTNNKYSQKDIDRIMSEVIKDRHKKKHA